MVSEHASPLAALGGVDAGGQNVHVAALAAALGRRGHEVDVYTRRDEPACPSASPLGPGVDRRPRPAGPPRPVPKDELYPQMAGVRPLAGARWAARGRPDVVHAHFWMSGLAALQAPRATGIPVVADLPRARRRSSAATRGQPTPARRSG